MSQHYYEERLEQDLARIRQQIRQIADQVEKALQDSRQALMKGDHALAYDTILGDHLINRSTRQVDLLCHYFVARHLPSAGHLRFISSVLRLTVELERIGDYAVTICRELVQLSQPPDKAILQEVDRMADHAFQMFRQAAQSFLEANADLAQATMGYSDQVHQSFQKLFADLVQQGEEGSRSATDLYATVVMINRLERVASQSKNICEETVFWVTGATKPPKDYRILFLDERNDCLGHMAVSMARKAYPNSGEYFTAGRRPAEKLSPAFEAFMQRHGFGLRDEKPSGVRWSPQQLSDFHVIVSLQGDVRDYISPVPFRTIALAWDIPAPPPADLAPKDIESRLEEIYKAVAHRVRGLLEALRGEEAC